MKEEKSKRGRKGYPLDFKWRVIDDLLATGESIATTSQRYGITTRTIRNWLRTFGVELPNQSTSSTMSKTNKNKAVDPDYAELKRENARLKAALFQAESKALVNKTLLEVVLNRYHIDLKKKDRFVAVRQLESAKVRDQKLSITYLCQQLEVSRKGYYKHTFTEQDEDVKVASVLHYCQYVRSWLPRAGVDTLQECTNKYFKGTFQVGRDWLYKVLGANDMLLRSSKRKRPPQTTKGVVNHGFQDHLNTTPKYIATDHCRLTVSDITYVKCLGGFAYLSLTMDAYSRIITGFDLQPTLSTEGPYNALRQTVDFYQKHGFDLKGLIFHSDRGCQYVSKQMTDYEASLGIVTSVTQTGNPLHNAMAERLNGIIKNDWLYNFEDKPIDQVREILSQTIALYNTARPHRALNKKTPMQMLIPDYPNPLTTQPSKNQISKNNSPKAPSLKTPSPYHPTPNKELSLCTSEVKTTTSRVPLQEQN